MFNKVFTVAIRVVSLVVAGLLLLTCNVGLGTQVDTTAPSVTITYPPVNSVIKNTFTLSGKAQDETSLASVIAVLKDTSTGLLYTYEATTDSVAKTWSAVVNPSTAGVFAIPDGSYQVTVTAKDKANRTSVAQTLYTIDNTAPVLILQRPGTVGSLNPMDHVPTPYGTAIKITGMVSDSNSVDRMDFRAHDSTNTILAEKTLSNIASSIEVVVDEFDASGDALTNAYTALYGTNAGAGTKEFYCQIDVSDEAREFNPPISVSNDRGNISTSYYLYDEIYSDVLRTYTVKDIQNMYNGSYGRNADGTIDSSTALTVAGVKATLATYAISEGTFSINPKNNPTYSLLNFKQLPVSPDWDKLTVANGSKVSVKVAAGLDQVPLNTDSIRISVVPYDNPTATPVVLVKAVSDIQADAVLTAAEKLAAIDERAALFTPNGDIDYTVSVSINGAGIQSNTTYLLRVVGRDKAGGNDSGNDIDNDGVEYGFKVVASGTPPSLNLSKNSVQIQDGSPYSFTAEVDFDNNAGTLQIVRNPSNAVVVPAVNYADGYPTLTIPAGETNIDDGTSETRTYDVIATDDGITTIKSIIVYIDGQVPVIDEPTVSPRLSLGALYDKVNGYITIKGIVADDDKVLSSTLLIEDVSASDNIVYQQGFSNMNGQTFLVDTTAGDFIDGHTIRIVIEAEDRAFNVNRNSTLVIIDQSSDNPKIELTNMAIDVVAPASAGTNLFANNFVLLGTIADDDKIDVSTLQISIDNAPYIDVNSRPSDDTAQGSFKHTLTGTAITEGVHNVRFMVSDTKTDGAIRPTLLPSAGTIYYAVDKAAPVVAFDNATTGIFVKANATQALTGTASDTNGLKTWDHDSNAGTAEVQYINVSVDGEPATKVVVAGGAWTYLMDTTGLSGSVPVTATATDIYSKVTEVTYNVTVDSTPPVLELGSISPIINQVTTGGFITGGTVNGIVTVRGSAGDNYSLKTLQYKLGGAADAAAGTGYSPITVQPAWNVLVDTRLVANGATLFHLRAVDTAGNITHSTITLDVSQESDRPVVTFDSFNTGVTLIANAKNNLRVSGGKISGTITDDDGIDTDAILYIDGTPVTYTWGGTAKSRTFEYSLVPLLQGKHTVDIVVSDSTATKQVGEIAISNSNMTPAYFAYDTSAPTVTVATSSGNWYGATFAFAGNAQDGYGLKSIEVSDDSGSSWTTVTPTVAISGETDATLHAWTYSGTLISSLFDGINEGEHTFVLRSTDVFDRVTDTNFTFKVDTLATSAEVTTPANDTWTASYSPTVLGTASDPSGSGLAAVYYAVGASAPAIPARANRQTLTSWTGNGWAPANGTSNWSATPTLAAGTNNLWVVSVDLASNCPATISHIIKVDGTAPTATIDTLLSTVMNGSGNLTVTLLNVADAGSGLASSNPVLLKFDSTDFSSGTLSVTWNTTGTTRTAIISASDIAALESPGDTGSHTINARIIDAVGNTKIPTAKVITVDRNAPDVEFTAPLIAANVNGIISVTGTASDDIAVNSIALSILKTGTTGAIESDWVSLGSASGTVWAVTNIDTTALDNGTYGTAAGAGVYNVTLRTVATDTAGNSSPKTRAIKIDQNTDRSTINVTTISANNGVLMYGTNAQINGTVADDDSISTNVVGTFIASGTPLTSTTGYTITTTGDVVTVTSASSGTTSFVKTTGEWSYTPNDVNDGTKSVYFYVVDNNGGIFYTGNASTLNDPYIQFKSGVKADNTAAITYKSDSEAPNTESQTGVAYDDTADALVDTDLVSLNSNVNFGGVSKRYAYFTVSASDANGIAGMTLTLTDSGNTVRARLATNATAYDIPGFDYAESHNTVKGAFASTSTNASVTWYTGYVDLSACASGTASIKVRTYDQSGLYSNNTATVFVDNSVAETFTVSSPSKSVINTASITVTGSAYETTGSGLSSVKWYVPLASEVNILNSIITNVSVTANTAGWSSGTASDSTTPSGWKFQFDGLNNALLESYCNAASYGVFITGGTGYVYTIPVYFLLTDTLGNTKIVTDYAVQYNPHAGWPVCSLIYPEDNMTVGGSFRVNGTATDNTSVAGVYIQIDCDKDGDYDVYDANYLMAQGYAVYERTSTDSFVTTPNSADIDTLRDQAADATWWGIRAANTVSWYISLNSNTELITSGLNGTLAKSASETSKSVRMRASAVDGDNVAGLWSDNVAITVDRSAPLIGNTVKTLTRYTDDKVPSNVLPATYTTTTNQTGSRDYIADMYLNGAQQWYLLVSVEDTDVGIKSYEVTRTINTGSTETLTATTSGGVVIDDDHYYVDQATLSGYNGYVLFIPIQNDTDGTLYYKISATEDKNSGAITTSQSFEVCMDTSAPVITPLSLADGTMVEMNKLTNSNYGVSFGSTVADANSGFERLAFYFVRSGAVYNTIPAYSDPYWNSQVNSGSATAGLTTVDNMYGLSVAGTRTLTNTFTASSGVSGNTNVRAGGLIKIGGTYYTITAVSGNLVTFDGNVDTNIVDAFFPYALVVNSYSEAGTRSASGLSITGDDGDGIVETISKSGTNWTWDTTVMSDCISDGTATLVVVAFDEAGNISTRSTNTMISNHAPRLAKVYLATDLNGDTSYNAGEFEYVKTNTSGVDVTYYSYSALDSGDEAQQFVTLATDVFARNAAMFSNNTNPGATAAYLRVSTGLAVATEFVSGQAGGGTSIYYAPTIQASGLTAPKTGAVATTMGVTAGLPTVNGVALSSLQSLALPNATLSSMTGFSEDAVRYVSLTLYDNPAGTTPGTPDVYNSGNDNYDSFGSQYTVLNIPVYFDLTDSIAPASAFDDLGIDSVATNSGTPLGHVDPSVTLNNTTFPSATTSGVYDRDDKVSGEIYFTGTVSDNRRINSLAISATNGTESIISTATTIATYSSGSLAVTTASGTGWTFEVNSQSFTQSAGHTVVWKMKIDTSKVTNVTAADIVVRVTASDGTNNTPGQDRIDIVPYITGVTRFATTYSNTTMRRSTYGQYQVAIGDTLSATGFNFASGVTAASATNKVSVGTTTLTTATHSLVVNTAASPNTLGFTVPSNSGELTITVNSLPNLNSKNNNAMSNNHNATTTTYHDNCYLRVWDLNHYFSNSGGGYNPTMASDNAGNLFSTWTLMGTASLQIQRGLGTTNKPIYICYDQPDKENWLSVDKSVTNGNVSAMYFPANVGNSGTPDSTGYAEAQTLGGAWGVGVANDITTGYLKSGVSPNKYLTIDGNPYTTIDSKINTAGWQLASYSMRREVSQFKTPRTVRYGDAMHFAYYDTKNKALRYTYQPIVANAEDAGLTAYQNTISGWTLIDGTTDGQDRVHSTTDDSRSLTVSSITTTSVTLSAAVTAATGNSVGIAYTDAAGSYKFALRTITGVTGAVLSWSATEPLNVTGIITTGAAVYRGATNVVAAGAARSDAAGSYIGMDVTSSGYPVVVYYDSGNDNLRIAYATSKTPDQTMSTNWTRQALSLQYSDSTAVTGGTYVQSKIDPNNYLHILFRDGEGNMCYVKSTNAFNGAAANYTFGAVQIIDSSGTYGTLSLIRSGTVGAYVYTPCVAFLNSEQTASSVKFAILRTVDNGTENSGTANTASVWDTAIVPAVISGGTHYATGGEMIAIEGNPGTWSVTDSVNTTNCDAMVGFNTGRMDVVFLKKE